jgi:hypothetical protein
MNDTTIFTENLPSLPTRAEALAAVRYEDAGARWSWSCPCPDGLLTDQEFADHIFARGTWIRLS